MVGECNVFDYKCKYFYSSPYLILTPYTLSDIWPLYRKLAQETIENKIITIDANYSYREQGRCIFKATNATSYSRGDGVRLDVKYFAELFTDQKISQIRLTSKEFTNFVDLTHHYYHRYNAADNLLQDTDDLLYGYDTLNHFEYIFNGIRINADILTGGLLELGIASDLKLKAYLVLSFENQDLDFAIDLFESVYKTLLFLCYQKHISLNTIDLININDKKQSVIGHLCPIGYDESYLSYPSSPYQLLSAQMHTFFTAVANDNNLYTRHLPSKDDGLSTHSVIRLFNIFSAFENEYNRLQKSIRRKNNTNMQAIRKRLVDNIRLITSDNSDEQKFIDKSIQRIQQIDTAYSEVQRIENAYAYCNEEMSLILEYYKDFDVSDAASTVCALRDRIVHNNYDDNIDDIKTQLYISFLEWLTLCLMLKRYDIKNAAKILCLYFGYMILPDGEKI